MLKTELPEESRTPQLASPLPSTKDTALMKKRKNVF